MLLEGVTLGLKRTFDERFFTSIDTSEKAYWLGFFVAEGCVHHDKRNLNWRPIIQIGLGSLDKQHLERFVEDIGGDFPVKVYQWGERKTAVISLYSKVMADDLVNLGVGPRKSCREVLPGLEPSLMRHFVRGYFDGDGCVTMDRRVVGGNRYEYLQYTILGGRQFVEDIQQLLLRRRVLHSPTRVANMSGPCWRLKFSGLKDTVRFSKYLYEEPCTRFLLRKREVAAGVNPEFRCS